MTETHASERNDVGRRGEDAAVAYLERSGIRVLERNWRCRAGEIDVIGTDGATLVLIEVKTRRTVAKGSPEEAVTPTKRRRIARVAAGYLATLAEQPPAVRFDVVTLFVLGPERALLRHHRAAFEVGS
ncbi:MAG: YraN family protein [Actinobacteria bacterium]|nr:MAG: YraN family protein [Actinomycetota bacterium]